MTCYFGEICPISTQGPGKPGRNDCYKVFQDQVFFISFSIKIKNKNTFIYYSFVFVTRALRYRFTNALAPTQKYDLKESI